MIDPTGRNITYLRVSVTDRCDFRCVYCMSEQMSFLPKSEILSLEELERLCFLCPPPCKKMYIPKLMHTEAMYSIRL